MTEDGSFTVTERGGNVSVVSYAIRGGNLLPHVGALRGLLGTEGTVEAHPDGRWLVATVPVAIGFTAIEKAMTEWGAACSTTWSYGNVYDEHGEPLNWW